ncbi:MAG TPA: hypothetical protein VK563_00280 [Puia sp.]|nr:hypothetical protein [Puia sp.]
MRYLGINYDTGTKTTTGGLTREVFSVNIVRREIELIRHELHCNAIRISGDDIGRIVTAAEIALATGLTVWFSPSLRYKNQDITLQHIIQGANAAERLRRQYPDIIFVAECELTLFTSGFVKGETGMDRMKRMFGLPGVLMNMLGMRRRYNDRLNDFLLRAMREIRMRFHGQVTYASGPWEKVNWDLFDIVGVDLYRASYNKQTYEKDLQHYKKPGKLLSITEFGCCTFHGADDKGAMGWAIVDWKQARPALKGKYVRDETVQSNYLLELLELFDREDVFAAFVYTFASYNYLYNEDPAYDLDLAAYGVMRVLESNETGIKGLPLMPKKSFFQLGGYNKGYFGDRALGGR